MDVNHPFSFINLLLAFINRQIYLPTMILTMRKYPSLKNRYKYLLKSASQKSAGQVHHCKSQKRAGGGEPKANKQERQTRKKIKKKKKTTSVPRSGPQQMRKQEVQARALSGCWLCFPSAQKDGEDSHGLPCQALGQLLLQQW